MSNKEKIKTWIDKNGNLWMYASGKFNSEKMLSGIKKMVTNKTK